MRRASDDRMRRPADGAPATRVDGRCRLARASVRPSVGLAPRSIDPSRQRPVRPRPSRPGPTGCPVDACPNVRTWDFMAASCVQMFGNWLQTTGEIGRLAASRVESGQVRSNPYPFNYSRSDGDSRVLFAVLTQALCLLLRQHKISFLVKI